MSLVHNPGPTGKSRDPPDVQFMVFSIGVFAAIGVLFLAVSALFYLSNKYREWKAAKAEASLAPPLVAEEALNTGST